MAFAYVVLCAETIICELWTQYEPKLINRMLCVVNSFRSLVVGVGVRFKVTSPVTQIFRCE